MGKSIKDFNPFLDMESQAYYAQGLPKGRLFANRYNGESIIYKLFLCLAQFIRLFSSQLHIFAKNIEIQKSEELLPEWEDSVNIPSRYSRLTTLEERRNAVQRKISKVPVYNINKERAVNSYSTIEEYVRVMTGLKIEIDRGSERSSSSSFAAPFKIAFGIPAQQRNFLFYVMVPVSGSSKNNTFPLGFPVNFFDPEIPEATKKIINTALEDVVPSFCAWILEAKI